MTLLILVKGLCFLVTSIFVMFLVLDIFLSIVSKFTGKQYTWSTQAYFSEISIQSSILLSAAIVISGACLICDFDSNKKDDNYPEPTQQQETQLQEMDYSNLIECDFCGERYEEKYAMEMNSAGTMCPLCYRAELECFLDGEVSQCMVCNNFYLHDNPYDFRICQSCEDDYKGECKNCGTPTIKWDTDDFSLCPSCAGEIFSDPNVQRSVDRWFEG